MKKHTAPICPASAVKTAEVKKILLNSWLISIAIAAFVCLGTVTTGPSDIEAAQDSADDTTAAQQLASDTAACHAHYGPRAQTFLLDGMHLVCRPPQATVTAQVQP